MKIDLFILSYFVKSEDDSLLFLNSNCFQRAASFCFVVYSVIDCFIRNSYSFVGLVSLLDCGHITEFDEHFHCPVWLIARSFFVKELYRVLQDGRNISFHCMNLPTRKVVDGFIGIRDFRGDIIRAFIKEGFIYHAEVTIDKNPQIRFIYFDRQWQWRISA